jgi:hypothetical protein
VPASGLEASRGLAVKIKNKNNTINVVAVMKMFLLQKYIFPLFNEEGILVVL